MSFFTPSLSDSNSILHRIVLSFVIFICHTGAKCWVLMIKNFEFENLFPTFTTAAAVAAEMVGVVVLVANISDYLPCAKCCVSQDSVCGSALLLVVIFDNCFNIP